VWRFHASSPRAIAERRNMILSRMFTRLYCSAPDGRGSEAVRNARKQARNAK